MKSEKYIAYINDVLSVFLNDKDINKIDFISLKNVIKRKRFLQSKMVQKYLNNNYMTRNTNINHKELLEGKFNFSFDYQRYDMEIKFDNFLEFFYNCFEKNYYYYFTNCGMSALFSTFSAFKKYNYDIERLGNIYVETERLLDDYILKEDTCVGTVLYIDSSSFIDLNELLKNKDLSKYSAFIFDTTDYLDDISLPIINKLLEYNKIICLVRSHIKLDMLGTEWNKLGSICVINPKDISNEDKKLSKDLKETINVFLSVIGGFAYPENMPLIWNNDNFKEINKKRIDIIKNNTLYLYNRLTEVFDKSKICYPFHGMFILLRINHKLNLDKVDEEIDKYIAVSKYKGLINFSDSFGLDYYAISNYWECMQDKYPDVRVIVPDYPEEINQKIVDELIGWLKEFYKKFN